MTLSNPSGIILLGSSSAGKTSIAHELLKQLPQTKIEYICYDKVYFNLLKQIALKHNNQEFMHLDINELYEQLSAHNIITEKEITALVAHELRNQTKASINAGNFVILNYLIEDTQMFEELSKDLSGLSMTSVLVYCNPENLLKHLHMRNSGEQEEEHREEKITFEHFFTLYKPSKDNEKPVDTLNTVNIKHLLKTLFATTEPLFLSNCIQTFKLEEQDNVNISPIFAYDIIVNTSDATAQTCAQQIAEYIKSRSFQEII